MPTTLLDVPTEDQVRAMAFAATLERLVYLCRVADDLRHWFPRYLAAMRRADMHQARWVEDVPLEVICAQTGLSRQRVWELAPPPPVGGCSA